MLMLVTRDNAHLHWGTLASMHQLRRKVFKERLGWDVSVINGLEIDQYDIPDAHYLVRLDARGCADACTRLLPTSGPYLLADVFPQLVEGPMPRDSRIWESTRFCANHETAPSDISAILMAGMLEFGLLRGLSAFVSVSDVRMEPIMRRAGWKPIRLGGTLVTATDTSAAERLDVTAENFARVRSRAGAATSVIANAGELFPVRKAA